jgi:hypothetical protein
MDDCNGGCLVLRNCACGSTRARQGDADDRDEWEMHELDLDLAYCERLDWNRAAWIADSEERMTG